jgi:hypothetical protein
VRKIVIAIALAFAVTLAAVIGNRMSAEAMAVVVGVVCGVAAGIPMSMLLIFIINRSSRKDQMGEEWPAYGPHGGRQGAYPPVVVIQGGTSAPSGFLAPYYSTPLSSPQPAQRQFHIVGEQDD